MKTRRYGNGGPCRRIFLVAPRHPENFWSMQGTVNLLGARTLMPNAALATLMALTPPDVSVEYVLCDENVSRLDWAMPCDLVAVTGATLHAKRIREICSGFRNRGVEVALGGTYASLNPDQCGDLADYLFIGEAEYTWPVFLQQWVSGSGSTRLSPADLHRFTGQPGPGLVADRRRRLYQHQCPDQPRLPS